MKDLNQGFIALFRQFTEWEWYDDANTMRLFIHCLLLANYKDKKWRGKLIKRGSFITSQSKLAHSLKLSIKQIRGSLTKLKTTGEVAVLSTPEYSVITVKNYNLYQDEGRQKDRQKTQEGQTEGRQRATTNNRNNIDSNIYNISLSNKEKISEKEREILNNYVKRNKLAKSSVRAYVNALIKNGDHIGILKEEKLRIEKLEAQQKLQAESWSPEKEEEKPSPEDTKRGLELLRNTAAEIKRRRTK